jgi:hypothetical protein
MLTILPRLDMLYTSQHPTPYTLNPVSIPRLSLTKPAYRPIINHPQTASSPRRIKNKPATRPKFSSRRTLTPEYPATDPPQQNHNPGYYPGQL